MAAKKTEEDSSLKRLGGGRWQTRDDRFTIEPQSGTWVLVDAEQTDDLGLPLVRGPYRSLSAAKAAVEAARGTEAPASPLADRVEQAAKRRPARASARPVAPDPAGKRGRAAPPVPEAPAEPGWIADLGTRDRGRARKLIAQLAEAGVRDAASVVRQDMVGGVPTVARVALARQLAALLSPAGDPADTLKRVFGPLLEVVGEGRDDELGVRWRLVDGEDRPVGLTAADLRAAIQRQADRGREEEDR